jgi:hypothetical protein
VKLVDEDTRWYLSAGRSKLREDVRCNVVVADDVVELETVELVLKLANFWQYASMFSLLRSQDLLTWLMTTAESP